MSLESPELGGSTSVQDRQFFNKSLILEFGQTMAPWAEVLLGTRKPGSDKLIYESLPRIRRKYCGEPGLGTSLEHRAN